jgi:zinc transporter
MGERDQLHLREEADRVTRYVEDLDAARERAAVTQEELGNRLSEQLNSRMYVLSVVAAIFLPLGFLTGLFGINVGGIPMAENPQGFIDIVLMLLLITGLQVVLFRWRRWL